MYPEFLKLFVYIAIFAAAMLGFEAIADIFLSRRAEKQQINKRLHLISTGADRSEILSHLRREVRELHALPGWIGVMAMAIDRKIEEAGLHISLGGFVTIMGVLMTLSFGVPFIAILYFGILISPGKIFLLLLFSGLISVVIPMAVLARLGDKRQQALSAQFPVALDVFVRGLRAGHPVASALELLALDLPDPLGSEFGIVVDEITYGLDMRDAVQNMADRCGLEDMQMFAVCLSVQSETGGNLAEILENLSRVIRERASMYMMVRALSSEGRMTGAMLTALPVLAFVGLFALNPSFYLDVSDDPAFFPSVFILLILYAIGFYAIRRMIDLKV